MPVRNVESFTDAVLCLASASPRRRELLASIGVATTVMPADIDETPKAGEAPDAYVVRLAQVKALAVAPHTELPVLGSDTAVVVDDTILGKPCDEAEACAMLTRLSGRRHRVVTGVAVSGPEGVLSCCVSTWVSMRAIGHDEMRAYWATGEPADKAGGYAIQGLAAVFIDHIEGSHSAVVGLPLYETAALLARQGVALWHR